MIAPLRPIAFAAAILVSGCVAPALQAPQGVSSTDAAPRAAVAVAKPGGGGTCGGAAAASFAAAAQVVVSVPVACGDLGPGGNLVAGCERGAVDAMTRQALTCAAIKPLAQGRYASCAGLPAAASGSGPQRCEVPPAPAPVSDAIEVGSLTGYGYIYKSSEFVRVRTSTASGVKEITGQSNPDGTTTIETRGFTATRDRNGGLINVEFHDQLK